MQTSKSKNSISIYSISFLLVLGLMLVFSGSFYGTYRLSKALAENRASVLSDDDDREEHEDSEDSDGSDDDDEIDDIDEDDSDDSDELEDDDELDDIDEDEDEDEDGDEIDDEDEDLKGELENFVESQKDLQEESTEQFKRISERDGVIKFLVGPNLESIRKLQEIIEANTRMLEQIQQVRNEALTPEEQQALDALSGSIENQNTIINNQLSAQESGFSLFGWLARLFSRD
ncbi:hypothetical protein A2425_01810 [candidate division WWE3 bacterium RIFOXYC1_FULL_42_17]|nr:MAG: hypothetical protein A2200_02350 [candidate division WWE3 bacterium RIFOXYA1_FULL_41_11]OGC63830.1 MAG: hypothetical protein A2399_02770 [candidate division WWE3 bacterium RIFOXYB1_FULL_42_27]OGC74793.1 MAG: hypothetical protein A2425_01810 [candidate division WWE3 bacterium RIFOXYC1_FULL_42_17]